MHAEELLHVLSKEYPAKVEVLLLNALDVTGTCHFVPVYSSEGLSQSHPDVIGIVSHFRSVVSQRL